MSTKGEKKFQSLSSLSPCRLDVETPVCTISQKSAKLPQAAAAVTLRSGNLMSGGAWQQPHPQFSAPVGVDRCVLTVTQQA